MIPKIIHQIWLGSPVPRQLRSFHESWKRLHPDWECRLWSEKDLDWLKNKKLYDNAFVHAKKDAGYQFQSDLARYEILYRFGGVYIDMDTEPIKPIDELMNVPAFAVWESKDEWIANGIMGSVPQHNFLGMIIDGAEENVGDAVDSAATHLVGPRYLSRMFFEHKPDMEIYPTHYFLPYLHGEVRKGKTPEFKDYPGSYAVHHWNHARTVRGVRLKDRRK